MIEFKPRKDQDKVYSKTLYDVIEGESRIGQIEITLTMQSGFKSADISWITPTSLAVKPSFKELAVDFAKKISEEYNPTDEDGVRYWVKSKYTKS